MKWPPEEKGLRGLRCAPRALLTVGLKQPYELGAAMACVASRFGKSAVLFLSCQLLASCGAEEHIRLGVWAKQESIRARYPDGPPPDDVDARELDRLRTRPFYNRWVYDPDTLAAEARKKRWQDSHHCRPPEEPTAMHSLVIFPREVIDIYGRQTPETCRARLEGIASVEVLVRADGTVAKAKIYSGVHPLLDALAVAAVESSSFLPARLCGRPIDARMLVNVPFNLASCRDVADEPSRSPRRSPPA